MTSCMIRENGDLGNNGSEDGREGGGNGSSNDSSNDL